MMSDTFALYYYPTIGLVAQWQTIAGNTIYVPIRVSLTFREDWRVSSEDGGDAPAPAIHDQTMTFFSEHDTSSEVVHRVAHLMTDGDRHRYRAVAIGANATVHLDLCEYHGELTASLAIGNPLGPRGQALTISSMELRFEDLHIGDGARYLAPLEGASTPFKAEFIAKLSRAGAVIGGAASRHDGTQFYLVDVHGKHGYRCQFHMSDHPTCWIRPGSGPEKAHWAINWRLGLHLQPGERHAFYGFAQLSLFNGTTTTHEQGDRSSSLLREPLPRPYASVPVS